MKCYIYALCFILLVFSLLFFNFSDRDFVGGADGSRIPLTKASSFTFFILLLWKNQMLKFMFVEFWIWELKFDSILWPHCELQMSPDQVWTCRFRIRYISSCISFNGAFVLPSSSSFPCIKLLSGYPVLTLVKGFSIRLCKILYLKEPNHEY